MKARHGKIWILGLGTFVVITALLLGLLPGKTYSESERRRLATKPKLTIAGIQDKTYMTALEDYLLDHFPLRESFRRMKAFFSYTFLQQQESNDIYLVEVKNPQEKNTVFASKLEYPLSETSVEQATKHMKQLQQQYFPTQKVYYAIVPDKNYFLATENGFPSMDYDRLSELMNENLQDMEYIDLWDTLSIWDYYSTDTHWRQERLEPVVRRIAERMGFADSISWEYETVEVPDFYGVYYGQSALLMSSESLYYLTNETIEQSYSWNLDTNRQESVYAIDEVLTAKNTTLSLDKYNLFLQGAQSVQVLQNPQAQSDKRLILFRDSFGSSIAPLFLDAYREIVLIDTRYISTQLLENYVDFANSDIFFLYNALLLNQSSAFKEY